jgi:hypothetical protein
MVEVRDIRNCQARVREVAQKFSVETALNGLAAVAAEAIVSSAQSQEARDELMRVFTAMLIDYMRSVGRMQSNHIVLGGTH